MPDVFEPAPAEQEKRKRRAKEDSGLGQEEYDKDRLELNIMIMKESMVEQEKTTIISPLRCLVAYLTYSIKQSNNFLFTYFIQVHQRPPDQVHIMPCNNSSGSSPRSHISRPF